MKLRNKLIATIVSISMVLAVIGVGAWASTESFTATITNTVNLEFDNIKGQISVIGMSGADNLEGEAPMMQEVLYDGSNVIYNQISSAETGGTNFYWDGTLFMDASDDGLGMVNARTEAAALMYAIVYEPTEDCAGTSTITAMVTETSLPEISGGKLMVKYFATTDGNYTEITSGAAITPIYDNEIMMVVAVCQYYNLDGESIATTESAWDFSVTFTAGRTELLPLTGMVQLDTDPEDGMILPNNYVSEGESRWEIIEFGEYPQTLKASDVTITSETPDEDGYYPGSDGARYAKLTINLDAVYERNKVDAETYASMGFLKASDGTQMAEDGTYYFKVEPIKWRVLSDSNGELFLASHRVLDGEFGVKSEELATLTGTGLYERSEYRSFLINNFYNKSFSDVEKGNILTTHVDNSYFETLDGSDNVSESELVDTEDKVFLLSMEELRNNDYGFATEDPDLALQWVPTDYAKARSDWQLSIEAFQTMSPEKQDTVRPFIGSGTIISRTGLAEANQVSVECGIAWGGFASGFDNGLHGIVPAMRIVRPAS